MYKTKNDNTKLKTKQTQIQSIITYSITLNTLQNIDHNTNFDNFTWKKNLCFSNEKKNQDQTILSEDEISLQDEFMKQHKEVLQRALNEYLTQKERINNEIKRNKDIKQQENNKIKQLQNFQQLMNIFKKESLQSQILNQQIIYKLWCQNDKRKIIKCVFEICQQSIRQQILRLSLNILIKYHENQQIKHYDELNIRKLSIDQTKKILQRQINFKNQLKLIDTNINTIEKIVFTILSASIGFFQNIYYFHQTYIFQSNFHELESTEISQLTDQEFQYRNLPLKKIKIER